MNQIPNIEEWKKLAREKLAPNVTYIDPKFKEVASWAEELLNAFWVEQQKDLDAFIDTFHHQLQKAVQEEKLKHCCCLIEDSKVIERCKLHGDELQKARKEILKEIDIGNNDYVTARRSVAELSGVPMMAITFDEHIKVIKEKLDHSELDQDKALQDNKKEI